ncbi:hypothetical protein PG990_013551 [Apiospora arundinis]
MTPRTPTRAADITVGTPKSAAPDAGTTEDLAGGAGEPGGGVVGGTAAGRGTTTRHAATRRPAEDAADVVGGADLGRQVARGAAELEGVAGGGAGAVGLEVGGAGDGGEVEARVAARDAREVQGRDLGEDLVVGVDALEGHADGGVGVAAGVADGGRLDDDGHLGVVAVMGPGAVAAGGAGDAGALGLVGDEGGPVVASGGRRGGRVMPPVSLVVDGWSEMTKVRTVEEEADAEDVVVIGGAPAARTVVAMDAEDLYNDK